MISPILQMRNLSPKEIKEFAEGQTQTEPRAMSLHASVLPAGSTLPLAFRRRASPHFRILGQKSSELKRRLGGVAGLVGGVTQ